ncbi:hypothetical protein V8J36_07880 [Frigidibacter sp. MR17.14]|uniref:hypothetical protein n=1 Tax=Frigidibacter sp. MR17.14 TaxID=3126509 RepID=UPI003012C7B8
MRYEWMIDVLSDLARFAEENRMPDLVQRLEEARLVAELEIARREQEAPVGDGLTEL